MLLDLSIVGVLLGILTWYWQKNEGWRAEIMCRGVEVLLFFSIWVALWRWQKMSSKGAWVRGEEGV